MMGDGRCHNVANGVISALVLLCGVTFSALVVTLITHLVEDNSVLQDLQLSSTTSMSSTLAYTSWPLWALGFGYMIPGLIGCISFCVKHKAVYITQMVFTIISLLIMGIVFIGAFLLLSLLIASNPDLDHCTDNIKGQCECSSPNSVTSYGQDSGLPYSCGDLKSMYGKSVGILLMIVFGWILSLTTTIISGILACRSQDTLGMMLEPRAHPTSAINITPANNKQSQAGYIPTAPPPPSYGQPPQSYGQPPQNYRYQPQNYGQPLHGYISGNLKSQTQGYPATITYPQAYNNGKPMKY